MATTVVCVDGLSGRCPRAVLLFLAPGETTVLRLCLQRQGWKPEDSVGLMPAAFWGPVPSLG